MSGPRRAVVASLATAVALIPLCPSLVTLTHAPVPGVALLSPLLVVALAIVLAALVATWVCALALASTEQPLASVPALCALAAFPGAAALAALLGFDPLRGALFVAILVGDVIWYAAIVRFVRDARALDVLLGTFVVSGAVAALLAIVLVVARVPAALYTIGHGRAIGTFVLPGELAGYLIVYVPVAFALARRGGRLMFAAWIGFAIGAAALALTFSRAGWAGFAAAVATFAVARRGRLRYAVAVAGAAALTLGLVFNAHHDPSENFTRLGIWEGAVQTIVRFPFSGVGPLDFANVYPLLRAPAAEPTANHGHSIVLTIAAECGLVGLAALVWGWWRFSAALRARWSPTASHANVAVALAAGLLGTWVQGLIDTSSVVIFGLWLPMMALALVSAGDGIAETAPVAPPLAAQPPRGRYRLFASAALVAVGAVCAVMQLASSALYAPLVAGARSLPAHLPTSLGTRLYTAFARIGPLPFVEASLADDALRRGDLTAASAYTARMPHSARRSDCEARIAAARGQTQRAIARYLDADDDVALQHLVDDLQRAGRLREAYALERRVRDRLAATTIHPNALAASWWRLGRLAARLHDLTEADADLANAVDLAPLNTTYLLDAARVARERHDDARATALVARAHDVDPNAALRARGDSPVSTP